MYESYGLGFFLFDIYGITGKEYELEMHDIVEENKEVGKTHCVAQKYLCNIDSNMSGEEQIKQVLNVF